MANSDNRYEMLPLRELSKLSWVVLSWFSYIFCFLSCLPKGRQVCVLLAWGGQHDGVGRVGLGPRGFPSLHAGIFTAEKEFSGEITMSTLPKWVI